jgi:hypothetical protein
MPTTEKISLLAAEAFIFGYPIVDNHKFINIYVLDSNSREYKALYNAEQVFAFQIFIS